MKSSSLKNIRTRQTAVKSVNKFQFKIKKVDPKKQIETTLNELHQLQSQLEKLNVPQNPHSSSPVKKQIKTLSYLYENMTKPKTRNNLNVKIEDIQSTLSIINQVTNIKDHNNQNNKSYSKTISSQQISLLNHFKHTSHQQQSDTSINIPTKSISNLLQQLYGTEHDLSIITTSKTSLQDHLTAEDIYDFITLSEFDNFDPLRQAYNCLLDDYGRFSFKRFNQINGVLGMPKVKEVETLKQAIGIGEGEEMTFEKFKYMLNEGSGLL